ncbi:Ankyrin repeat domain-containing protein 66-like [Oopsacas minuta]|uniref:Ankyrin repeat domain-containing protein 66-like n=1 Tax=Oopsacas minuta TaxID=111878 RepID=A0AAV7K8R2_9METZ|nr:Ankyrin repeat domain-containing protein 66-like [Oopsacas minuta]
MVDMHESASIGDLEGLEEALNSGYHPDDPDNDWGIRTALHLSASAGFRACVALLIARGADVNAQMYDNSTPLHCACEIGHLGIIFLLLNHGANPLAIDRYFNSG